MASEEQERSSKEPLATKEPASELRQPAHARLGPDMSPEDVDRLVFERQQAEKRYELATHAGKTGVWDWNLETNEIYVDPHLKALLGYEDHEIRNHLDDWGKLVHPDDREQVKAKADAHFEGLTPHYEVVHRMLRKDGGECWFLARGTAMRDARGRPYRVVGTDTDITGLKKAEQALSEASRTQSTLIEALPYPAMLIQRDRSIILANQVARQAGAVIGGQCWHDFGQALSIPDDDKASVNQQPQMPPGWTHCTFCLADDALDESAPKVAPEVNVLGKIWEIHWVPVSEDVYLHFALDITKRKRAEGRLAVLARLSQALCGAVGLEETLRLFVATAVESTALDCAGVYLLGEAGQFDLVYSEGLSREFIAATSHHPADSPNTRLLLDGQPVYADYSQLQIQKTEGMQSEGLRATAIVPAQYQGRSIAGLNAASHAQDTVSADDRAMLETLASLMGGSVVRAQEEELRKRAEEDLLKAQRIAKLGFWDLDIVSGELCWSDETFRTFGFEPQSFVPDFDRFVALVHPDDLPLVQAQVDAALRQEADYAIDFRVVLPGGAIRHVSAKGEIQTNQQGEVVRFFGTQIDITARMQAEDALRESEQKYRTLFERAHDGILVSDVGGERFRAANPAICAMLGYSEDELLKLGVQDIHRQEDLPDVLAKFRQQVSGECRFALDVPFLRKDGSILLADSSAAHLSFSGASCVLGVFRDVTDRSKAKAATLRASLITTTLAGGVAHDFNNLMVGVLGNAELLRDAVAGQAEAMEMLAAVSSSARQAGDLAKQLLAFARGGKYSTAPLNLNDIVQDTLRRHDSAFPPRIRIERDIEPDLWLVEADRTQLMQVVMNLLVNAVEAIEGHGRIVVITRNVEPDESFFSSHPGLQAGGHVLLCVEDTGCGIDSETRGKVFEPFFSTKSQGRGLGLAAVDGIISNHGGVISVHTELGLGTTFKAYLPKTDQEPAQQRRSVAKVPDGTETVLIIDDEPMVRNVAKRMLERLGYKTLTANNGHEGVELARSFAGDIHLAILDMGMPVMGGAQAFPLLKEARPDLKVLICSGYELDRAAQELLDAGASAFVQKPFRMADLGPAVRESFSDPEK